MIIQQTYLHIDTDTYTEGDEDRQEDEMLLYQQTISIKTSTEHFSCSSFIAVNALFTQWMECDRRDGCAAESGSTHYHCLAEEQKSFSWKLYVVETEKKIMITFIGKLYINWVLL